MGFHGLGAVEIVGAKELRAQMKAAGIALTEMRQTHREMANAALRRSKSGAPVRTGRLRATMRASGTNTSAVIRAGNKSVPYAPPIHWGWPYRFPGAISRIPSIGKGGQPLRGGPIRANPWASWAARKSEPEWFEIYNRSVERILETIKGAQS